MLWIKAFHVIFMVTWFAGLFYLPRLFVYHAETRDTAGHERFKVMERKLFAIMTIGAALTLVFGLWLLFGWHLASLADEKWLQLKLLLVALLFGYHYLCWRLMLDFRADRNRHGHVFYRWFNEFPALILMLVVILAVVRPF